MKKHFMLMAFGLFSFTSCLDKVNIELPQGEKSKLIISGYIERTSSHYHAKVYVSNSFDVEAFLLPGLADADITLLMNNQPIRNLTNNQIERFLIDELHASYGSNPSEAKFSIQVDDFGKQYRSAEVQVIENAVPPDFSVQVDERQYLNENNNIISNAFVGLKLNGSSLNSRQQKVSSLYQLYGTYLFIEVDCTDLDPFDFIEACYVNDPRGSQFALFQAKEDLESGIKDFVIDETKLNYRFNSTYYYTIIQKSLNKEAAEYWAQVQQSLNRSGSIYDVPAGKLVSNIFAEDEEKSIGYFYASQVDTFRFRVNGNEVGNPAKYCVGLPREEYPACCNCEELAYGSKRKPHFWNE